MFEDWQVWRGRLMLGGMILLLFFLWLGRYVDYPQPLVVFGVFLAGLGTAVLGVLDIRSRESRFEMGEEGYSRTETYRGLSAISWGVFFILLGLTLSGGAALVLFGLGDAALAFARARPGGLLILGGFLALTYALPTLRGAVEDNRQLGRLLTSLPGRLLSVLLIMGGLLLIGLGVWETAAPGAYDAFLAGLAAAWGPPP